MHISDMVVAELLEQGFTFHAETNTYLKAYATGGSFGISAHIVSIDVTGRWFESLSGLGNVEKDVDLRNFSDAKAAIAALLGENENS